MKKTKRTVWVTSYSPSDCRLASLLTEHLRSLRRALLQVESRNKPDVEEVIEYAFESPGVITRAHNAPATKMVSRIFSLLPKMTRMNARHRCRPLHGP